ncbi:MAG: malonyl-CoA synthase [Xanthomonadales bacterium]|nr:malonyl-CoA synthase [Xanthomonadales bacterium]
MKNHLFDGLMGRPPGAVLATTPAHETMSYGDALDWSGRFANALASLGVQPGDRVAVQVPKSLDAVWLYLGCLRAGAVFLPLNTAYTVGEVNYFLRDARPRVLVADPVGAEALRTPCADLHVRLATLGSDGGPEMDLSMAAAQAPSQFENAVRGAEDLAAILYTSGTTGRSKGAMLTHENLLSNARTLAELWQFSERDVLIHALPIFHVHGLFVAIHTVMISGASMIFLPRFSSDVVLDEMRRATVLMGVPTFYTRLLESEKLDRERASSMRVFISGSAPLLEDTFRQFEQRTGHRILERYGMTEAGMITSNPCDGERRAGTVGFPLPGVRLRVVDAESGAPLAVGHIGSIEIRGPNVFAGYWEMPERTAEEFRGDGYFVTGDLGRIDEGGYLHIVGRGKDLIISGGYNIYPKEVELALDADPDVLESAVIGVPHPDLGEAVVGVLVAAAESELDLSAVAERLAPGIARFKQPRRLLFVDSLPRNAMGKVQKNVLRELYSDLFIPSDSNKEPIS